MGFKNYSVIKGNFKIEKIEEHEVTDEEKFEQLIARSGVGSHMVFRSKNKDDEFFINEL